MTRTIALAGKGGTGKTTVSALLIRSLLTRGIEPILAIDADPAINLHMALGLEMPMTIGEIRENMLEIASAGQLGVAISRRDHLTHEVRMALEEGEQVDLLAMGRPEGQGCYCAANHLLREIVDELGRSYDFLVIDNEAGMEHISRRTTKDLDLLLVVSDPSLRGMRAAESIVELARDIEVNIGDIQLVINRVSAELTPPLQEAVNSLGLKVAAMIPADERVNQLDAMGDSLLMLEGDSPASQAVENMTTAILGAL